MTRPAQPWPAHMREERTGEQEHRIEVDGHYAPPFGEADLVVGPEWVDARVVDEDVGAAGLAATFGRQRADAGLVAHVAGDDGGRTAGLVHEVAGAGGVADVGEDELCPVRGELLGVGAADALGRAGDHRGTAMMAAAGGGALFLRCQHSANSIEF